MEQIFILVIIVKFFFKYKILGGQFVTAGGIIINNVAKWDRNSWYNLGENTK